MESCFYSQFFWPSISKSWLHHQACLDQILAQPLYPSKYNYRAPYAYMRERPHPYKACFATSHDWSHIGQHLVFQPINIDRQGLVLGHMGSAAIQNQCGTKTQHFEPRVRCFEKNNMFSTTVYRTFFIYVFPKCSSPLVIQNICISPYGTFCTFVV